ncbi:MAG TPA: hypothetical protein PLJ59_00925 [Solirubrobacterales bacterium]|nr:hypothetical protein [Solirubrobacterales bacterium]
MTGEVSAGPVSTYTTGPVADINPGAGSGISNSVDPEFTAAGNRVFFVADDGVNGKEVWVSDGRPGGSTQMAKDINPAPGVGSNPRDLVTYQGEVYFSADDGASGRELWKSDGTEAGTVLLKDIQPGTDPSLPGRPVEAGGKLFFAANEGPGPTFRGNELWVTDGTGPGTVMVRDIEADGCLGGSSPRELTEVGGLLYFVANFSSPGCSDSSLGELWKSDGTEAGTERVSDLNGPGDASDPFITSITALNGLAVFAADLPATGQELFASDGTDFGTNLVMDIKPGSGNGVMSRLAAFNGWVYFQGNDSTNRELWRSNVTSTTELFKDVDPAGQSQPDGFTVANGALWFDAFVTGLSDEPWVSDGTPGGTNLVKDINTSGNSYPEDFTGLGDRTFFLASDTSSTPFTMTNKQLWQSDGTAAGTFARSSIAPGDPIENKVRWLTKAGPRLIFAADNNDGKGFELWSFADNDPPETSITSGPASNSTTLDVTPEFGFDSDDLPATFECRLFNNNIDPVPPFGACSGPGSTHSPASPLADGAYRFEVRATDESGNVDPTPVKRGFIIDGTAPQTEIDSGPVEGSTITGTSPTFGFSSPGSSGTSFECRLFASDHAPPSFSACSGPGQTHTPAAPLAEGTFTFEVRATDPVGNTDQTPASRTFTVKPETATDKTVEGAASARKTQKQRGRKVGVAVRVKAGEDLRITLSGKAIDGRRKLGLRKVTGSMKADGSKTIVLRLARKQANRPLLARIKRTRKVRALVMVTLSDQAGNRKRIRLPVKLR